jgi:hypothetical protein
MVLAKTSQTVDQEILNGEIMVLLRPDLAVKEVTAPEKVMVNTRFTVEVITEEKNSDVGATCKVEILNGDQVLDTANGVEVSPGGVVATTFLLNFNQAGTYNLKSRISGVTPGDYDSNNNEASFTVNVIGVQPMYYYAAYDNTEYNTSQDYYYYPGYSQPYQSIRENKKYEYFNVQYYSPDRINPEGTFSLKINTENGTAQNLNLSNISLQEENWDWGYNYIVKRYYQYMPDINGYVDIIEYPQGGTYVYFHRSAGNVTYSNNWYGYYNSYNNDESGQLMDEKQLLSVDMELFGQSGTSYGGSFNLDLKPYDFSWDNWFDNGYYGGYVHMWVYHHVYSGSGSGLTKTGF